GRALLENFALLVGQSISPVDFRSSASHVMVSAWLVFSLIVETAYRSNLTAHLTAPVYNARAETLPDLVETGATVTMPPYGESFRDYFLSSSSPDYRALG
ncbi:Ionotropic glutamate receptor, partial [Trinorchestia longiramus]